MLACSLAALLVLSASEPSVDSDVFDFFAEELQVVTASRRPEPARVAPMRVEVITADEIRAFGAANLWDLIRFRAGADVLDSHSTDGNRAIVAIRGFPQAWVNNLLVLLDGQTLYTGLSGGTYWGHLPVQLQDVERVEIVYGPSSALYGSNAGLGVINIITRKPQDPLTGRGRAVRRAGMVEGAANIEAAGERYGYRLSYAYDRFDGFPQSQQELPVRDFVIGHHVGGRAFARPLDSTTLDVGFGSTVQEQGTSWKKTGPYRDLNGRLEVQHVVSPEVDVRVMLGMRSWRLRLEPSFRLPYVERVHDVQGEVTGRVTWWDGQWETLGGITWRDEIARSRIIFGDVPPHSHVLRGFVRHRASLGEHLAVTAALSVEESTTGGVAPAVQAAVVVTPTALHTVRLSYGYSPTIPALYESYANHQPWYGVRLKGNPELEPERLQTLDLGYSGAPWLPDLQVSANLFVTHIRGLRGSYAAGAPEPPDYVITYTYANQNDARAYGAEASIAYRPGLGQTLFANYTFERVGDLRRDKDVIAATPHHKANVGVTWLFGSRLTASAALGFKSRYRFEVNPTLGAQVIPPHWRVDARFGYRLLDGLEAFVSGHNLLGPHVEAPDGFRVPRLWWLGLAVDTGAVF